MITTESISTPCFSFIAKQAIFSTREHRNSILFVSLVSAAPCCYRKLYPLHKRVLYITIHNRFYKYLFPRTFTDVIIDFFFTSVLLSLRKLAVTTKRDKRKMRPSYLFCGEISISATQKILSQSHF